MTDKPNPSDAAASRTTLGFVALLTAFILVLLQALGSGGPWASVLAIVLAITGSGLRIEAAIARHER